MEDLSPISCDYLQFLGVGKIHPPPPYRVNEDLWNRLNSDISFSEDYSKFQNVLGEVLNKHSPLKKKYLRANNSPFMTKQLRKMIMNRSRCKNSYFKNKTVANWEKYGKLRNDCVRVTIKGSILKTLILMLSMRTKHFGKRLNPILVTKI